MIKSERNIKLIKNFKMEYPTVHILPSNIEESDVNAMFCGILKIIKMQAKQQANAENCYNQYAYNFLLNMYQKAVKNMNKYKALYYNLKQTKTNN